MLKLLERSIGELLQWGHSGTYNTSNGRVENLDELGGELRTLCMAELLGLH